MAISPTSPIVVSETVKVEQITEKTFDQVGIESLMFRWEDNNAGGRVSARCRLRPYNGTTGELASPQSAKAFFIADLMAEASEDAELAAVIEQLFAVVGRLAVENGVL